MKRVVVAFHPLHELQQSHTTHPKSKKGKPITILTLRKKCTIDIMGAIEKGKLRPN
jgi:hypothetical protein